MAEPPNGPAKASVPSVASVEGDFSALHRALSSLAQSLQATLDTLRQSHQIHTETGMADLVNELLLAKVAKGCRHRYLVGLRITLVDLVRHLGEDTPASTVTPTQVQDWLLRPEWGTAARRSCLIDARTLFAFGVRRGYLTKNPAAAVEMPRREWKAPGIHTPEQVQQVLEAARSVDVDVMRLLAVQYFAGLRPAEAARITEADILPGFVQVSGEAAKTRQRRLVTIHPALRAWLDLGGKLPVLNRVRRYYRVRYVAGVPWSHDVTRHSFVSYHLAEWRSAAQTALEAGHTETVLFNHYRELVTPDRARAFWAIRPRAPEAVPEGS